MSTPCATFKILLLPNLLESQKISTVPVDSCSVGCREPWAKHMMLMTWAAFNLVDRREGSDKQHHTQTLLEALICCPLVDTAALSYNTVTPLLSSKVGSRSTSIACGVHNHGSLVP